jgi:hypothetical protein
MRSLVVVAATIAVWLVAVGLAQAMLDHRSIDSTLHCLAVGEQDVALAIARLPG